MTDVERYLKSIADSLKSIDASLKKNDISTRENCKDEKDRTYKEMYFSKD